jgi:hypothetical protein
MEVLPEVVRPKDGLVIRIRGITGQNHRTVGWGQIYKDYQFHGLGYAAVIDLCLLRAVVSNSRAGLLDYLRKRREKCDHRDMRPTLRRRQHFGISSETTEVVTLAEEVGFSHGGIGKRCVKGVGRRHQNQNRSKS